MPLPFPVPLDRVLVSSKGFPLLTSRGSPVMRGLLPLPAVDFKIYGITRDSSGNVIPTCIVMLYTFANPVGGNNPSWIGATTSDANGYYEFRGLSPTKRYFVIAYKSGAPDVSGTTVDTLIPVL